MILLIGSDNWCSHVTRMLTDRSYTLDGSIVKVVRLAEHMRGTNEHVEVIVSLPPDQPMTLAQRQAVLLAEHINRSLKK